MGMQTAPASAPERLSYADIETRLASLEAENAALKQQLAERAAAPRAFPAPAASCCLSCQARTSNPGLSSSTSGATIPTSDDPVATVDPTATSGHADSPRSSSPAITEPADEMWWLSPGQDWLTGGDSVESRMAEFSDGIHAELVLSDLHAELSPLQSQAAAQEDHAQCVISGLQADVAFHQGRAAEESEARQRAIAELARGLSDAEETNEFLRLEAECTQQHMATAEADSRAREEAQAATVAASCHRISVLEADKARLEAQTVEAAAESHSLGEGLASAAMFSAELRLTCGRQMRDLQDTRRQLQRHSSWLSCGAAAATQVARGLLGNWSPV